MNEIKGTSWQGELLELVQEFRADWKEEFGHEGGSFWAFTEWLKRRNTRRCSTCDGVGRVGAVDNSDHKKSTK